VFEQSYGSEGLYVIEVNPRDPAGPSRLNLQRLNAAAQEFQSNFPDEKVSLDALREKDLMPELLEHPSEEQYFWDEERRIFTSSLGGNHTPGAGALLLLRGNQQIRQRIISPDKYARQRWKKIYTDEDAPEFLKREIVLREFLLDHFYFPASMAADQIQGQLERLEEYLKMYAVTSEKEVGDEVTWADLDEAGLSDAVGEFPKGTEVKLGKIGDPPTAIYQDMEITADKGSVGKIRYEHAKNVWEELSDYPPALALRARFEDPKDGLPLINKAVQAWPNVLGLRVERMTQHARRGDYHAWGTDMAYLTENFPAAPLLIEVQLLADTAGLSEIPEAESDFALTLANLRPDLLTHQLYALRVLEKAGRMEEANNIHDRMAFANPAWRLVLPEPGEAAPEERESGAE